MNLDMKCPPSYHGVSIKEELVRAKSFLGLIQKEFNVCQLFRPGSLSVSTRRTPVVGIKSGTTMSGWREYYRNKGGQR